MSEICPNVTFSPEGVMEIRREFSDEMREVYKRRLSLLGRGEGFDYTVGNDLLVVQADIRRIFSNSPGIETGIGRSRDVLESTALLFGINENNLSQDQVFVPEGWYFNSASGQVFLSLQNFLNSPNFSVDDAQFCLQSMAWPLSINQKRACEKVTLRENINQFFDQTIYETGVLSLFRLVQERKKVDVTESKLDENDNETYENRKEEWQFIDLQLDQDTRFGVSDDESKYIHISPRVKNLYLMNGNNVDLPTHSLSFLLGMGALSYLAVR